MSEIGRKGGRERGREVHVQCKKHEDTTLPGAHNDSIPHTLTIHHVLFLWFFEINVRCLYSNDGLVEQTESLLNMLWMNLS